MSARELGTGALCQQTVIILQYSKSLFAYENRLKIDCAKSSPALFSSN